MDGIVNKCDWHQDEHQGDTWGTDCGHYFTVIDGSPADNEMKFCPFCGDEIEQHEVRNARDD